MTLRYSRKFKALTERQQAMASKLTAIVWRTADGSWYREEPDGSYRKADGPTDHVPIAADRPKKRT